MNQTASIQTTLLVAQSIDGFITKHDTEGTSFCSDEDFAFLIAALKGFDCMIMGRTTFELNRTAIRNAKTSRRLRKILTRTPSKYNSSSVEESIEFTNRSLPQILNEFTDRGYSNCVILGGTEVYTTFLQQNLVDELWVTIEPLIFGTGKKLADLTVDLSFDLLSNETLSKNTLLLKYKRRP